LVEGSIPRKEHVQDLTLMEMKGSFEILGSILEKIHKEFKDQTLVKSGEESWIPK
jgi:hypothetical protein